ncbi:MAG: AAA family ATPase, partial [archaeon]|nr:AAA family ATPase [archaeon]
MADPIELPWIEKYRPHTLAEVVGQKDITKRLESYVKQRTLPNLLFSGPAGVGKTSSSVAIAKEFFGPSFSQNFLELNASDERGIDVVRETIKNFARTLAFDYGFKIIFLDESDALTTDAQQALRRTMEKYSRTCRFILSCNYSSRLIEPIQSRCVVFRFKPLSSKDVE